MKRKIKIDRGVLIATILLFIGFLMLFFPYFKLNNLSAWHFKIVIPEYDKLASFISGVTTPFLSLAAFFLLYLTYKSQKKELNDSKQILISQTLTQKLQRFETTYFNILSLHHTIVKSMHVDISIRDITQLGGNREFTTEKKYGRDCFSGFFLLFNSNYFKLLSREDSEQLTFIKNASLRFFKDQGSELTHYFNNLFNLFMFINQSEIDGKQFYVNLLCAQLSSYELLLLFYYGLSDMEPSLAPYIIKFHVFRSFPKELILDNGHLKLYNEAAYNLN